MRFKFEKSQVIKSETLKVKVSILLPRISLMVNVMSVLGVSLKLILTKLLAGFGYMVTLTLLCAINCMPANNPIKSTIVFMSCVLYGTKHNSYATMGDFLNKSKRI